MSHTEEQFIKKEKKDYSICLIATSGICTLLAIGLVIQIFFVSNALTEALHSEITNRLVIKPEISDPNNNYNEFYKIWESQYSPNSGISVFQFFVFNITNPNEVATEQAMPIIDQIGPFVYSRYETKTNISWSSDNTIISYTANYDFVYNSESSTSVSRNEYIYSISGQMIAFLNNWSQQDSLLAQVCGPPFNLCDLTASWDPKDIFAYQPIEVFLNGYVDERLAALTNRNDPVFFINNESVNIQEYTGYPDSNLDKIRELIVYRNFSDNSSPFQIWNEGEEDEWIEYASPSRESGRQFIPESKITKNDVLLVWGVEKFRKVKYVFQKEIKRNGLDLLRFRIADEEWWSKELHNESVNDRYGQTGPHDGVMRLDRIRDPDTRIPIMLSKGLFLDAPFYQENITRAYGLNLPDIDFDEQYLDIEPISGTAFRIHNTYMISLQMNPIPEVMNYTTAFGNYVYNWSNTPWSKLPSLWIPQQYVCVEAFAQEETLETLVSTVNTIDILKNLSIYGGAVLAVVCLAAALYFYCKYSKSKKDLENYENLSEKNEKYGSMMMAQNKKGDETYQ